MKIVGVRIDDSFLGVKFERRRGAIEGGQWIEWRMRGKPLDQLLDAEPIYGGVTIIVEVEEQTDMKVA
jgi:hypothetical protein